MGKKRCLEVSLVWFTLQVVTVTGVRVADILESEKVTPPPPILFQNKRVADILESQKIVTMSLPPPVPPVTLSTKLEDGTEKLSSSETFINSGIYKKYPMITMTQSYNKEVPPKPKAGGPIEVEFYILVVDIRDINEVEEEMAIEYNLQMFWKDERLTQWDQNATYSRKKYEVLSRELLSDIWIPDVFIDHVKKMDQHELLTTPSSLRLYYAERTFRFSGRFTMKVACQMDFHYYPADTQRCPVNIKSYAYDNRTIFVSLRENKEPAILRGVLLPNFQVGISGAINSAIITSGSSYSQVKFIVVLRRYLGFHLIQTYLPSCLFVVISFLTFLVSSESVLECLTLCMTTLLTLTAMFAAVKQNTPVVSYVKGLDIWMVTCIFCVFFTLLEHTVLLKLRTQITEKISDKKDKKKLKKRKSLFNLTPSGRGSGSGGKSLSKPNARPSQEPLNPFYKAGLKKAEHHSSDDSGSDSSQNIQLRRYPQPTPPASIHLSPMTTSGTGGPTNSLSTATLTQRLSQPPPHSPIMMPQNAMLLPPTLGPQFATMLSKKASKRFKFSRTLEILCAKLIPISFLVFNMIYWPWLLWSADYYNNTAFETTKYV